VVPFGNFFEIGYFANNEEFSQTKIEKYYDPNVVFDDDGTIKFEPYLVRGDYINWEFRYPVKILESTRGKVYVARYLDEVHVGFMGREMSMAGSVFDFRFDALVSSRYREPQYVFDLMVQKVFDYWGFSVLAIGPIITLGTTEKDNFGLLSGFVNLRIKVGSSL
jgi:hypothetical protein